MVGKTASFGHFDLADQAVDTSTASQAKSDALSRQETRLSVRIFVLTARRGKETISKFVCCWCQASAGWKRLRSIGPTDLQIRQMANRIPDSLCPNSSLHRLLGSLPPSYQYLAISFLEDFCLRLYLEEYIYYFFLYKFSPRLYLNYYKSIYMVRKFLQLKKIVK